MLQIDIFLVEVIKSMCLVSRFYWYLFIYFFNGKQKSLQCRHQSFQKQKYIF